MIYVDIELFCEFELIFGLVSLRRWFGFVTKIFIINFLVIVQHRLFSMKNLVFNT